MAVKLKDIAQLAGVSESTVSRALNNSDLVNDATRQTVLDAARRLRYQTNQAPMIGVIEPKITNPLYSEIILAIEARTYAAGYGMLLCDSAFDQQREQDQLHFLLRQGSVHGIILIPVDPAVDHVRMLAQHEIPCVVLGTEPVFGMDQVNVDAAMGAYAITHHLLELGHRSIAMIQGPERVSACRDRLKGYRQALEEFNIPFDPDLISTDDIDEAGGAQAMGRLLECSRRKITGVFAVSDIMALGALRKLREAGVRVPEEISLAGCDDILVAAQLQPALTTVWQPKRELGSMAVSLLFKQIEAMKERKQGWKAAYPFQSTMYLPHIIIRESTRKCS